MSVSEREFYIEWISIVENYSIEEKIYLTGLADCDIEKKYLLALIKVTDEVHHSHKKIQ
ncbi:MAG: hypothetical protein ACQEWW_26355 [Bacillota bacterium]